MRNRARERIIGFFPSPYPDELLYSVCARFTTRAGYPSVKSVLKELFGSATAAAVIDLPNRLGYLAATLPANSSLTVDHLIDRHTLLPYFSAFQPISRVNQLRDDLKVSHGPAGHMRSGIMASRIPIPDYLRFCPSCKLENDEYLGETYWHRLHQLPGVEICPLHRVFLENSSVALHAGRKHIQFISAEQVTQTMPVRYVDKANRDHQALLHLSRDAEWLLKHPSPGTSLESLYGRYLRLLVARGLATYAGSIHVKRLLNEFTDYYSPALLKLLHCEWRNGSVEKTNWLLRLVRPAKHAQHPLYHLLLIQFLGCTVEEFFQLPDELSPFGAGPWPCLNPAAFHYKQPVIMECQLGGRLRYGKPTGMFICECGFAYVRIGPDASPEDRFRVGRIISFGQVWEYKLNQLWEDSSLSISEIGRRLGVDPLTVRRHAVRLKLPLSRSDKRLKPLPRATQLKEKAVLAAWERKRQGCRAKWLSAMKREREFTLKALRSKLPREYAWLLQNDLEWLKSHRPQPRGRVKPATGVDWRARDAQYVVAVKSSASRLRNAPGRPIQITRTAIGRDLGATMLLRQKHRRMPLTTQVLARVIETREEYAVRRIKWTADLYLHEKVLPQRWQLILRANVYRDRDNGYIRDAIQSAMKMLNSELSLMKAAIA